MTNYLDPTRAQFGAMMKLPEHGVVHMLNMLRFKEKATYPADHAQAGAGLSGAAAYKLYGQDSGPIFRRVGGEIVYASAPKHVLIGPEDEIWHAIFIAAYPSAAAFGDMVKDPDYQVAVVHRQAAVETSRLIRMAPTETGAGFAG